MLTRRETIKVLEAIGKDAEKAAKEQTEFSEELRRMADEAAREAEILRQSGLEDTDADRKMVGRWVRFWRAAKEVCARMWQQIKSLTGTFWRFLLVLTGIVGTFLSAAVYAVAEAVAAVLDVFTNVLSFFGLGRPNLVRDWVRGTVTRAVDDDGSTAFKHLKARCEELDAEFYGEAEAEAEARAKGNAKGKAQGKAKGKAQPAAAEA